MPRRTADRRGAFDGGNWRGVAGILAAFDGGAAFDVRHGRTVATVAADIGRNPARTVEPLTGGARSNGCGLPDRLAHGRGGIRRGVRCSPRLAG